MTNDGLAIQVFVVVCAAGGIMVISTDIALGVCSAVLGLMTFVVSPSFAAFITLKHDGTLIDIVTPLATKDTGDWESGTFFFCMCMSGAQFVLGAPFTLFSFRTSFFWFPLDQFGSSDWTVIT